MFSLSISFTNVILLAYYFSISLRLGSHNETNSLQDSYHSTETLCPRSPVHTILFDVPPTQTFWMRNIFTMSLLLMLSASKNTTRLKNSMWNVYDKNLKISFWSWVLRLLLDVRIQIYQTFKSIIIEYSLMISRRGNCGRGYDWCRSCTKGLFQR